ncbi:MAG: EF-P lysine aminoacylase EpmA [Pseudomonadota bacterium]
MTDWRPGATLDILRERARLNADLRAFFAARDVLEVETPLLCSATATDLHLQSFVVAGRYLQTSPEFALKRLLAAGSGAVYQLGKSFRAGESGGRHNPEFTMLEWYRPGWPLQQLMGEVEALLQATLGSDRCDRTTYRALFESRFGVNPHAAGLRALRDLATRETSYGHAGDLDVATCLDLLFSVCIESTLGYERPLFVSGFPAAQAALARVHVDADGDRVAARCEVYVRGMELANGYDELTDAAEQRRRFLADNEVRRRRGLPEIPVDERLLAALAHGLPSCSGIALGVDRLLMLRTGVENIDEVLAFSAARC